MLSPFLQGFYAVFSGAAEALSISNEIMPLGSPFIALFCLVPLYIAVYRARSYRESFLLFFLQTLTVHLASSYWLKNFHGFAIFTLGASALGTAVQGGLFGIIAHAYPHALGRGAPGVPLRRDSPARRVLWFCAVWVAYEWEKSTGALGYPWGTLFSAAYKWRLFTQIADLTGVWGITVLWSLASCVAAEAILRGARLRRPPRPEGAPRRAADLLACPAAGVCALFLCAALYGAVSLAVPRTPVKSFNAVIVQQNTDPWESGDEESISRSALLTERAVDDLAGRGLSADLVIWSEGVLSRAFPRARDYYKMVPLDEPLSDFIKRIGSPFLIGGTVMADVQRRSFANSAILFDANGDAAGFYNKVHLVPFAEKVPYADNPLMAYFMREVVGIYSSLVSGWQYVTFTIPIHGADAGAAPLDFARPLFESVTLDENGLGEADAGKRFFENPAPDPSSTVCFTSPICFEDAFPSVCSELYKAGSEVFINITNDSWSKTRSAELQHFIVASYLAIEFRTTLVRCANSGYSVVVGPTGAILDDLPLFKEASCAVTVPVYARRATLFSVAGDWLAYIAVLCVLAYLAKSALALWFPRRPHPFSRVAC